MHKWPKMSFLPYFRLSDRSLCSIHSEHRPKNDYPMILGESIPIECTKPPFLEDSCAINGLCDKDGFEVGLVRVNGKQADSFLSSLVIISEMTGIPDTANPVCRGPIHV